jgi:hypothetical protein
MITEILKESFTVGWSDPSIFGGCPITSFELMRDDGDGSDVDIPIDPNDVASRPDRYQFTVALDSTFTGLSLNVKVIAINEMGSVESRATQFVLADVPGKPDPSPQVDQLETTISQIKVLFGN